MEFKGKTALVTGAASGIGLATSKQLHNFGCFVILVDIDGPNLKLAENQFDKSRILSLVVDLTKEVDVKKLVHEVNTRYGKLDVLVNNAGIFNGVSVDNFSLEALDSVFKLNSHAVYHLTSLCVPLLKAAKGSVVNVSSIASVAASPLAVGYSMTKASVDSFTRCAAKSLASSGIRVNSVNPGVVDTNLLKKSHMGDLIKELAKKTPLGRIARPEDISEAICFLASARASYITGVHILIDGGYALIE